MCNIYIYIYVCVCVSVRVCVNAVRTHPHTSMCMCPFAHMFYLPAALSLSISARACKQLDRNRCIGRFARKMILGIHYRRVQWEGGAGDGGSII